uniref:GYF domain-containing protein n=1 Tax=Ostreococcus mediterraneus TaxID=1486918 RepID=A0A6U0BPF2_9CHLO|mmetsp:Transcript_4830/g.15747  ORF Transcript_4830/g.15747 Transcript_4830/m.15747 type:complete len:187 (-) Transcript_4830:56-616(-)
MSYYGDDAKTDATETRRRKLQQWDTTLDAYAFDKRNDLRATDAAKDNVWFYRDRTGKVRGPAPMGSLRQCWVNGVVDEHTLVWGNGLCEWVPVRNVRGLVANIRNPPTIFMHWLMRKFVDTDAKLEATRRERHERGEARSVTLRGDDVRSWNKSRDRDLRNGGSSLTGSLSLALPLRHVRAAANKH